MSIQNKTSELYSLEQISQKNTFIHKIHPLSKIFSTLFFIITIISFGKFDIFGMSIGVFYTALLIPLAEIPIKFLHKRVIFALPFCIFFAIFDLILLNDTAFVIGKFAVTFGFLSFLTILLKTYLCVTAVLILIATTKFTDFIFSLKSLYIPEIFLLLFELTYRYIGILIDEVSTLKNAYLLRSKEKKVSLKHSGAFLGSLILRSFARAERIFYAMKCRGYSHNLQLKRKTNFTFPDFLYMLVISIFCIFLLIRGR